MRLAESYVYLDWAATAPLCEEAAAAMAPYLVPGRANVEAGANANSLHTPGRRAFSALEDARARLARSIGASRPSEVVFTSGATEADNAAILGIIAARARSERQKGNGAYRPHFITCAIEHNAVLSLIPVLRERGCETTVLGVDRAGFVDAGELEAALRPDTALVSIMAANNEIGSVQDIATLASIAHGTGAAFHTDATQALGKVPVDVGAWGVDAASFSAHKVGGPKGVGALYLGRRVPCAPLLVGGGQEEGRRSGTQNVMGAAGFAAAADAAIRSLDSERRRLTALRDRLYRELCDGGMAVPAVPCRPGSEGYLPNMASILAAGVESETLILRLDLAGFAVSGGSACSTGSLDPSHVLSALGIARDAALCSLRISMGRDTGEADIGRFVRAFAEAMGRP